MHLVAAQPRRAYRARPRDGTVFQRVVAEALAPFRVEAERQFVLTVPFELRARLAFDAAFCVAVRRALHASLRTFHARRDRGASDTSLAAGGFTAIQRFGSGMNLHVHFHALVLDGGFVDVRARDGATMRFCGSRPLVGADVAAILADLVGRLVRARVIAFEYDVRGALELLAEDEPLGVASCLHRIALGPRRGQRVERVGPGPRQSSLRTAAFVIDERRPKARYAGFDLDASVRIPAYDRRALERLCRYLLRPPLSERRLTFRPDGKVELELKSPWPDGTTHVVFTPLELLEKLAALVPRPHENLLVYFGALAANANVRASVVAYGRPAGPSNADSGSDDGDGSPKAASTRSRAPRDWATLMRRGLGIDVLICPDCGGQLRIRAILDDPRVARPFAEQLGLVRPRAGPRDVPVQSDYGEPTFEPDPDFVEHDEVD